MRASTLLAASAVTMALATPAAAAAGEAVEIRAKYRNFVAAQNARDLKTVGASFVDGPNFLWVSDGRSFWGREGLLARMGRFQLAEV